VHGKFYLGKGQGALIIMKKFALYIFLLIPEIVQAQWTDLFDGRDLRGWKQINGKATYHVVNNEIVGTSVKDSPNSFLITEGVYGDFILELEFWISETGNSGIQIRSESSPDYREGRVHGYQVEIDPSSRAWTGGLYDEAGREWIYPMEYNPMAKSCFKVREWNKMRIECIGPSIRSWVNGIPTSNVVDALTLKGFIGLQVHAVSKPEEEGRQIRWRNIRIQTEKLQPSPLDSIFVVNLIPNTLSDQEMKNGYKLLWDGKTTSGWRGACKTTFPEKGWEIKDGVLSVLPSDGGESVNGGDLVTAGEFGAFDFEFEFKLTPGANSGVKYFVTEKEGNPGSAIGLEYQILDDEKHPDAKQGAAGNRTQASLYDLIPALKIKRGIKPIGEWNQGRIVVYPDNRIEHWLNGYKVVEYQRGSPVYQVLVARSKYASFQDFGMAAEGHILLQDHGNAVSFRSIKIKPLSQVREK
jgi:Domain of Unknown Function (DUF1080)